MKPRKGFPVFFCANIGIPLLLGGLLYWFFRADAFVSVVLRRLLALPAPQAPALPAGLTRLLTYYAADILWAYSLAFAVTPILGQDRRSLRLGRWICIGFEALLELLQRFGVLPGTFDVLDIVLEAAAICLAIRIIHKYTEVSP